MNADKLVSTYFKIRNAREKLAKEFKVHDAVLKGELAIIEQAFQAHFDTTGTRSLRPAEVGGTVFLQTKAYASIADWSLFGLWVRENDQLDMLHRRVASDKIATFISENDGETPPGVNFSRVDEVVVRKS